MLNRLVPTLRERLRVEPGRSSVDGSLPVLFFGDALSALVATIGLNPSKFEYIVMLRYSPAECSASQTSSQTYSLEGGPDTPSRLTGCEPGLSRSPAGLLHSPGGAAERRCRAVRSPAPITTPPMI
jgi:hypothetical protein